MSSDALSHFGVLDEIIQIIYEGVERFVLFSKVDYESWTIYLGLQGPEGRWWRGCWFEKDILHLTVRFSHWRPMLCVVVLMDGLLGIESF